MSLVHDIITEFLYLINRKLNFALSVFLVYNSIVAIKIEGRAIIIC